MKKNIPCFKRPHDSTSLIVHEKKIRLSENGAEKIADTNLGNDISIFESTLDSINVTNILENSETECDKKEFDAFVTYLCTTTKKPDKTVDAQTLEHTITSNQPSSQVFNTQVINQLDMAIISENSENEIEPNSVSKIDEKEQLPLIHSFEMRIKNKKCLNNTLIDQEIGERSVLFEDEKITTQYRQEVDNLFDEIEQTIFTMGSENTNKNIPDELLDVIFNDDSKNESTKEIKLDQTNKQLNESLSKSNINKSFCDLIKQALNNSGNSISVKRTTHNPQNTCNLDKRKDYHCLGPFYGLPFKVKELVMHYKGIKELYGKCKYK